MNLVISVTDSDQINIILSIIAKKRGSDSVISLINNETFSSFANDLGIDIFINPRELTTSRIIEKIIPSISSGIWILTLFMKLNTIMIYLK